METVQENVGYLLKRSRRLDDIRQLFEDEEVVQNSYSLVVEKMANFCRVAEHFVKAKGVASLNPELMHRTSADVSIR